MARDARERWRSPRSSSPPCGVGARPDLSRLRRLPPPRLGPRPAARRRARLRGLRGADAAPALPRARRAAVAGRRVRRPPARARDDPQPRRADGRRLRARPRAVRRRRAASPGAVFVGSSFAFALYAVRAFVDVPFLALVVWAAALEAQRPRRGALPMALLADRRAAAPRGLGARGAVLAVVPAGPRGCASGAVLLVLVVAAPRAVGARRPRRHRRSALQPALDERPRRRRSAASAACATSRRRS